MKLKLGSRLISILVLALFGCAVVYHFHGSTIGRIRRLWERDCGQQDSCRWPRIFRVSLEEIIRGPLQLNDTRLLRLLLDKYIRPPASTEIPYNFKSSVNDPSMGQSDVVKKLFKQRRNGFFIECGALDGETRSNTLSLERDLGWTGLLIEGDPSNFKLLAQTNRKAWLADCCLAIHAYPHEVSYMQDFNGGQILDSNNPQDSSPIYPVVRSQCFPLYSLLSAINVTTVDYFSLDVEGFELNVLRTIPFDRIHIKVLSVEFIHGKEGDTALKDFMEQKGYSVITKVVNKRSFANDFIFVHKSLPVPATAKFPSVISS